MRPLGQVDRLVHEEAHPILPQLVEPILESIDCTRVYDALWYIIPSVCDTVGEKRSS